MFIDGSINTLQEVNTFALAWAGMALIPTLHHELDVHCGFTAVTGSNTCCTLHLYSLQSQLRSVLTVDPTPVKRNSYQLSYVVLGALIETPFRTPTTPPLLSQKPNGVRTPGGLFCRLHQQVVRDDVQGSCCVWERGNTGSCVGRGRPWKKTLLTAPATAT